MTALALVLALVLLASFVLVLIPAINSEGFEKFAKPHFVAYALLTSLFLFGAIYYFIGFDSQRNYRIPLDQQRRIKHTGYYIAPDSEMLFSGSAQGNAFSHEALDDDETISLKPVWDSSTSRAGFWTLTYNAHTYPLRVGGECINLPPDWWFTTRDALVVYKNKGADKLFFSVRWNQSTYLGSPQDSYLYSQGILRNGQATYDQFNGKEIKDLVFSRKVLSEGIRLSNLLSHPVEEFAGVPVNTQEWSDIFDGILIVRERKDKSESRIGFLISNVLLQETNLEFNKNTARLAPVEMKGSHEIPFNRNVFYGLGYRNSLSVSLPNQTTNNTAFGSVVDIKLETPNSWPLPPVPDNDFIITSTRDYVPLDGYLIDVGQSYNPFYAIAKLNPERSEITINDGKPTQGGRPTSSYKVGEEFRLGDFHQGALLSLQPLHPALDNVGTWASLFLLIGTALFVITILTEKTSERWRLNLSWTLIWGLVLTVLVVRLILSYRVSLIPPYDANPAELAKFHRSLILSFWSLLAIPVLLVLVRHLKFVTSPAKSLLDRIKDYAARSKRRSKSRRASGRTKGRDVLLWLYWTVPVLWISVSKVLGQNEALLLRINIVTHVLLIIGILITAPKLTEQDSIINKLITAGCIITSVLLVIILIQDRGFYIYLFSLLIYVCLLFLWDIQRTYAKYVVAVIILSVFLFAWGIRTSWARNFSYALYLENVGNRIASLSETESSVFLARSDESGISVDDFLKSSQQHWQMMLYAATGSDTPQGYGQVPLTKRAMTYPTTMADCVFSIYLLSEHGKWAGFLLVLIYAGLGFACFYGSWFLPEQFQHRGLPLAAIGSFFAINATYMALANIKMVIFTGQNIPLLSLYSLSDIVQGSVLLALATWLLSYGIDASATESMTNRPAVKQAGVIFVSTMFILPMILLWGLYDLASQRGKYTEGYTIPKEAVDQIERNIAPPNNAWKIDGGALTKQDYATISVVEKYYQDKFNDSSNKYDRDGGVYYLKQAGSQPTLQVNNNYFKMESPFERDKNSLWRGLIVSRDDQSEAAISAFGKPFRFSVREQGKARTVPLSATEPVSTGEGALLQGEDTDTIYLEVKTSGGRVYVAPKIGQEWVVYVNGVRINQDTELAQHGIIVLEKVENQGRKDEKVIRYNLIYLGVQPEVLAFVKWRNGNEQRIIAENSVTSMVYTVGKAADQAKDYGQALPDKISLALDLSLHRKLQREVETFAKADGHYKANDPFFTDPLAVSVIDAYSGEVLALPSWPKADPSRTKLSNQSVNLARQARLLTNPNLTNHPVGSTIKPLVFSTIAHKLWPEDVSALTIFNNADSTSGGHIHRSICNIVINNYNCESSRSPINATDFLIHSLNFYEVTLGMLGSIYRPEDFTNILIPTPQQRHPHLQYRGRSYICDLTTVDNPFSAATRQPNQTTQQYMRPRPRTEMDKTILFQGLPMLFDVHVSSAPVQPSPQFCEQFLPSLCATDASLLAKNDYLDNILPERVIFDPDSYQDITQNFLRGFLIGANECRWNNVKMAEAAARLATGQRITAKLEHRPPPSPNVVADMPAPVNDLAWRRDHLITPMQRAGQAGTASELSGVVQGAPQYRVMYKTGTIDEGTKGRHSEALLFVIGRWDSGRSQFIPGYTLAGFLYMKESREGDETPMKKFIFARPIIRELLNHLQSLP